VHIANVTSKPEENRTLVESEMKEQKQNKLLFILTGVLFVMSPVLGIILSIVAILQFENYFKPYLFALIWGIIGLVIGYLISKRIKPFITKINKKIKDYFQFSLFLMTFFIGLFWQIGVMTNSYFSKLEYTGNHVVINKTYRTGHGRQTSYYKLFFELNGELTNVRCNQNYWNSILIGERIKIEVYKSKLGFDFILLPDEKKASL